MQDSANKAAGILIIGASSAIARATARLYAARGCRLHLIARNAESLRKTADDLTVRGASAVTLSTLDVNDFDRHEEVLQQAFLTLGTVDLALICHGSLPDQQASEADFELARHEINTNGLSVISLLTVLSPHFIRQASGTIAVVTSVAGDRGRQSNYVYGSVKAMVSTYLQGLRGRLRPFHVNVLDIRPGFVDSPMTAHLQKGPLWSSPQRIGKIIVRSVSRGRHTVYAPAYWGLIMFIVRSIPEALFKRIKL